MNLLSYLSGALKQAGAFLETKTASSLAQAFMRGDDTDNAAGARLTRPMAQSVWVHRAIKKIVDPITSVDLDFYADSRNGAAEINDPALAAFWEKPALDRSGPMGRADFIEATVGWLKLAGEAFWIMGDEWLTTRSQRGPLLIGRPDRMQPILDGTMLLGWTFTDASGRQHPLLKEQVAQLKFWNPYDDLRGLAEFAAAQIATEGDYLAGVFSRNLMRNNGDTGMIVTAKGGMPTEEQQAQITRSLREKKNASSRGDFRPIFLTGDVAIEDPKIQTPDADFVSVRLENRHEIAIAFGVPPSMFDVKASYSEGASSDRYQLLVDTCMPLANGKIADAIETISARIMGRRVFACFDFDDHDVMQATRRARIASVAPLFAVGVPLQQINDVLDLGLDPIPGWEKSYLPFSLQEVGSAPAEPVQDAPAATAEPDAVELMRRALTHRTPLALMQAALDRAKVAKDAKAEGDSQNLGELGDHGASLQLGARTQRDAARDTLRKAQYAAQQPAVKRAKAKVTKCLMAARAETLANLAKQPAQMSVQRAAVADLIFSLGDFTSSLIAELRKVALSSLDEAGRLLFEEIGYNDDPFTMPAPKTLEFIRERENLITDASKEVHDRIKGTLEEGLKAGEPTSKLAARVKAEFNAIDDSKALTIAQTETSAAYSTSRQEAMVQAGVEWKEWLVCGLENIRATHEDADGQRVAVADAFKVGRVHLIGPGIPATAADNDPSELINCRCVAIASATGPTA